MRKSPQADVFRPRGGDQNAQIWVGGQNSSVPCSDKVQPDNIDTARTIFDRMVRAACGFESEYVRDSAVDSFAVRRRVHVYARFDRRRKAKKVRSRTFLHVLADSTSPRLSPGKVRGSRGRGKDRSPFLSHERGD